MTRSGHGKRRPVKRGARQPSAGAVLQERVATLERQLVEAREREIATVEILRLIAESPADLPAVLDGILGAAIRLLGAAWGAMARFDGELFHLVAQRGATPGFMETAASVYPFAPDPDSPSTRAITERHPVYIEDAFEASYRGTRELARAAPFRSLLSVPLLREGRGIGTINLAWTDVRPFPADRMGLLQSFADQAVIAIENVRLVTELQEKNRALSRAHAQVSEALEQQTATSEILRVISSSPTDVQPVFAAILASATTLCAANLASLWLYDGAVLRGAAHHNASPEFAEFIRRNPQPPSREGPLRRAALERQVVHVVDLMADATFKPRTLHLTEHARTVLAVPLLRENTLIGVIGIWRRKVEPFTDKQISLLNTFADQAVIAIENVRLFEELRERTAQLGRSVEELTALGQVSQALSSTLDIDTVLTTIVSRAIDLSAADGGSVHEYDDAAGEFRLRATQNFEAELVEASRAMPLRRGEGALGVLAERREPVEIADISDPAAYQSPVRDVLLRTGYRALLAVPLLREDRLIGGLVIGRKATGTFPRGVVELLTTFANQSALAIQNARLFRELADKSRQLEVASQHKSEFLANMSHELRTPLNAIIGFSEVLTERMFGELNQKQDEYLRDIHASGQHLLSLINDILDLSKIEAGRMELELTDFDLPAAIDNALTLVRERAARHGIAVRHEIDARLGQIRADERKIKQVLLNLLSNAVKFTPEGGRIDVRAALVDGMAEVSVADTGVGIAPEDQEAVFEEFRRVGATAKKVEGTGLGLTLSRKFVDQHGGRIWVESEAGMGSTFTFTIPVRRGA